VALIVDGEKNKVGARKRCEDASHSKALHAKLLKALFFSRQLLECARAPASLSTGRRSQYDAKINKTESHSAELSQD